MCQCEATVCMVFTGIVIIVVFTNAILIFHIPIHTPAFPCKNINKTVRTGRVLCHYHSDGVAAATVRSLKFSKVMTNQPYGL